MQHHWLIRGLLLFLWSFFVSIAQGFNMADESWFLQVVDRISSGEILYRDVFFGVTPLPVYITAAFTSLFGMEILVVKGIVALCFVLIVLLCCRIGRQLGAPESCPLLLVLLLLVYAQPWDRALYNPLAVLFFLACFGAILSWRESANREERPGNFWSPPTTTLAMAGVAAGLSFASKQSVGAYALMALLLAVVIGFREAKRSWEGLTTAVFVVLSVFFLTSFVILLPVWFSGGAEKFLDYGFTGKGAYLRLAHVSYWGQVLEVVRTAQPPWSIENFEKLYWGMGFVLPLLTFPALLLAWWYSERAKRGLPLTVLCFVGAGFLGVFPRADLSHLKDVTPALLVGLTYAWYQFRPLIGTRWVHLARLGLLLWIGVGLGYLFVTPLVSFASGKYQLSDLPHFRGTLIRMNKQARMLSYAITLKEASKGEPIFLLSEQAGFYYLISGIKNPTPFDYPLATTFGLNGETELLEAVSRRKIRLVCLDTRVRYMPLRFHRYIQQNMLPSHNIGFCTLYRSRP